VYAYTYAVYIDRKMQLYGMGMEAGRVSREVLKYLWDSMTKVVYARH
jgi:hypothetical protein